MGGEGWMTRFGNVLESEITARKRKDLMRWVWRQAVEKGCGAGGSASALRGSAARLLPALQVEVRRHWLWAVSAPKPAAAGR